MTGECTAMPVQLLCPNLKCRKILSVPDETRGKLVKCQYCQTMLRVPMPKGNPTVTPGKAQK